MEKLLSDFKKVLDAKKEVLECFCKYGVQIEGWFKGEFLSFLDGQKNQENKISDFDREVPIGIGRRKVDFKVKPTTETLCWIELKHWLIGKQRDIEYNAKFYFGDPTSVGIVRDADKLSQLSNGDKFILIFATKNPGEKDWQNGLELFQKKFSAYSIKSLTNPDNFPDFYYIGLLKC